MKTVNGIYGSQNTPTEVHTYKGWYVCDGGCVVNRTHDEINSGVNVEALRDYDVFTVNKPINSLQELINAVEN